MAEGVGFEPTVRPKTYNGFRDPRLKPLGPPSGLSLAEPGGGLQWLLSLPLPAPLRDRALVAAAHLLLRLLRGLPRLLPRLLQLLLHTPHRAPQPGQRIEVLPEPFLAGGLLAARRALSPLALLPRPPQRAHEADPPAP